MCEQSAACCRPDIPTLGIWLLYNIQLPAEQAPFSMSLHLWGLKVYRLPGYTATQTLNTVWIAFSVAGTELLIVKRQRKTMNLITQLGTKMYSLQGQWIISSCSWICVNGVIAECFGLSTISLSSRHEFLAEETAYPNAHAFNSHLCQGRQHWTRRICILCFNFQFLHGCFLLTRSAWMLCTTSAST